MEALARWESPVLGPVPPARFVPVAEQTGLGAELDAYAVRRALADAAVLREEGAVPPDAYVAVNVSARSLDDSGLEQVLLAAVEATGTRPEHVVLEITENAVVDDAERSSGVLRRLRERGFSVAVDDFGTGYSSLAYLRDLPITSLKIDRSFVAGIEEDPDALAIVASVVDLARAVGLAVVAEGVETEQQAALLRRLGCAAAQGWLWSRAVAPDRIAEAGWTRGLRAGAAPPAVLPRRRGAVLVLEPEHGRDRMLELQAEGASLSTIAAALNSEGYRTPDGVRWHRTTVARAVAAARFPQLTAEARPDR
jgi:EAL domain-containing protein (putative c-di-GMP-specific phosphodiesterase class I)